jgi:hypothetical protein
MESINKIVPVVAASVILSAIIVGSGVYIYQKNFQEDKIQDLQAQIDTFTTPSTSAPAPTATTTATATTSAQTSPTYSSSKYNLSFTYPKGWNAAESSYKGANLIVSLREKVIDNDPGSDRPADLSVSVMEYVKPLDHPNMYTSLEEWLKTNEYKNVKAVTVGGRSAFFAEAGENMFGGGVYYFISQKDNSVIEIHDVRQDGETKAIIDSVKFAQ